MFIVVGCHLSVILMLEVRVACCCQSFVSVLCVVFYCLYENKEMNIPMSFVKKVHEHLKCLFV